MNSTNIAIIFSVVLTCLSGVLAYRYIQKFEANKITLGEKPDYDFGKPKTRRSLPLILNEISGLATVNDTTLACVQDEEGTVFIYDLTKDKIVRKLKFDKGGDYEGVARAGSSLYVLRSDGRIYEISNFESEDFEVEEYDTDIPVKDSEGLGFDSRNNRLLIAGKSEPKGKEYDDVRAVYAFDLNNKSILEKPVYAFDEDNIKKFVEKNKKQVSDEEEKEKKGKDKKKRKKEDKKLELKINPSGIAVHPITGKLYVLSSKDHLIYIFNRNSQPESVHRLNEISFNQPEGITFLNNGDMFISNEGGILEATLLFFPYQKYRK